MALYHVKQCAECPLFLSCETGVLDKGKNTVAYCAKCKQLHSITVTWKTEASPFGVAGISYKEAQQHLGPQLEQKIPKGCPRIPRKAKYKKGIGTHYVHWSTSPKEKVTAATEDKSHLFDILCEDCNA